MSGNYVTINQYTTAGFATGHVNLTIHFVNGTVQTFGKNWNGQISNPQGGWYREDSYLSASPPSGATLVSTSAAINIPDANVQALQDWLAQQVAGGAGTEPYALAISNCVDGINEVLAMFIDGTLDASMFMISNGTLVYNYARAIHNGASNLDSNGRVIITTPMYFVNPNVDLDMLPGWEPTYNPTKIPSVTVEPLNGLNGFYVGQNNSTGDGSHITNTDDPNWDGWYIFTGTYGGGSGSGGPVPPEVPSID